MEDQQVRSDSTNFDWIGMNAAVWVDLRGKAMVAERPFTSQTPLFGPLIVWLRTTWNNVAAKWYMQPLLAQQNQFNDLLVTQLAEQTAFADEQALLLVDLDRETVKLMQETAVLTIQARRMRQIIVALEERLDHICIGLDTQNESR